MEVNVVGYGLMGSQVATLLLSLGFKVNIYSRRDIAPKDLEKGFKRNSRLLGLPIDALVYEFHNGFDVIADALTIECVDEDLDYKKQVYGYFKNNSKPFLTNSSSFSPDEIGSSVSGIHFFNPISLKLVEIYLTNSAKESAEIHQLLDKLQTIDFEVAQVNNNRAYIANYLIFIEVSNVLRLIEKYGYKYSEIKKIYGRLYNGRDIVGTVDVVGIDVTLKILRNINEFDETVYMPNLLENAIEQGYLGKKNRKTLKAFMTENGVYE